MKSSTLLDSRTLSSEEDNKWNFVDENGESNIPYCSLSINLTKNIHGENGDIERNTEKQWTTTAWRQIYWSKNWKTLNINEETEIL